MVFTFTKEIRRGKIKMREFLLKIFSTTDGSAEIALFNFWHILYWLIIVGGSIGAAFLLKEKRNKQNKKRLGFWLGCSPRSISRIS